MTDIVDRLNGSLSAGYSELRKEAAVTITRLRAKLEAAEKERDFAKTEIARLHDDIRELTDVRVLDEEDRDLIVALRQGTATKPAPSVSDDWRQHAARMAALARKLREPDWHFESIREMQRELCALEDAALAAAPEAKP